MPINQYILFVRNDDGYAVLYIIFISFLIISALFVFLGMIFFYNAQSLKFLNKEKLNWACYSSAQIAESYPEYSQKNNFTLNYDSVNVNVASKMIGLFRIVTASAKKNNDSSLYECYFAGNISLPFNNALTVTHPNTSMTIAGETNITGNISAASNKVTKGNIFGIRNSNGNYLNGRLIVDPGLSTRIFNDSLVQNIFNNELFNNTGNPVELKSTVVNNNFINNNPPNQNYHIIGNLVFRDSSFSSDYRFYYFNVSGKVEFKSDAYLNANIIIHSDSSVTIYPHCHIQNIVLISGSKVSVFASTFKNVQIIAKDSIVLSNSYFSYPSLIVSYSSTADNVNLNKYIGLTGTKLNGSVLLLSSVIGVPGNKSLVSIDSKSEVQGLIYSENNTDISGKIIGSVYTYNVWYYKDPSEYINWLVDANINRTKLNKHFLIPLGFKGSYDCGMLRDKWIY